ncbi:hypothetical protein FA95DRAFT_329697 [Auriscalpium vulgare]|uniref:Uncharacterized protein n=1 Tax=Auriscalpium vulgare TaxID=40419 RepID=A0ACB8RK24_9AGAM|nr:hypothetical protein FA95DRAFT_329697 [Auriscalpium vulgare]
MALYCLLVVALVVAHGRWHWLAGTCPAGAGWAPLISPTTFSASTSTTSGALSRYQHLQRAAIPWVLGTTADRDGARCIDASPAGRGLDYNLSISRHCASRASFFLASLRVFQEAETVTQFSQATALVLRATSIQ